MNVEIRQVKTAAEQGFADAFAGLKDRLAKPSAVAALREAAFARFEARGLPHRRVEEWKYTDLRALMREAVPLAPPPDARDRARAKDAGRFLAEAGARRIVLVNGVFMPELSDLAGLEQGLTVGSFAERLARGEGAALSLPGAAGALDEDMAVSLNTAFMGDGAVIAVAPGARIERPLHVVSVVTAASPCAVFARSLVEIGDGAQITLIETHEGTADVAYQINSVVQVAAGDKARFDHIKIVREGSRGLHVGTLMAAAGAEVAFNTFAFTIGGAVVRNQLALALNGRNTEACIGGASLLRGNQHADNTLVVDHAVPHCTSREVFKSVVDDDARSVFQGKIVVRQHAQKTDGKMAAHALLLSESAEADAKPELEIFADDVVCGHGATAGALDEELLFYLKARGIPQKQAEALMIEAFVGEAADGVANEVVREALMLMASGWLAARG
ncbi:MAG: Fe-S cluster assembly protein SufD [Pseudorhodoplanes sp.]|nr:Fe-S cluster assembly protein SufD [Pseudorhodoplanes sp.]GIK78954.1 MAG: Fe-S cluster assembly protein SufD [Alphaproteobacteria bacterium]